MIYVVMSGVDEVGIDGVFLTEAEARLRMLECAKVFGDSWIEEWEPGKFMKTGTITGEDE